MDRHIQTKTNGQIDTETDVDKIQIDTLTDEQAERHVHGMRLTDVNRQRLLQAYI